MHYDDLAKLVVEAQKGDTQAQGELYENTYERVYYLALKLSKNPEDAMDIMQDSYISALQNIEKLENPRAFVSWIFRITANTYKNRLRKDKPIIDTPSTGNEDEDDFFNTIEDIDENILPEDAADRAEVRRLIISIIDSLPDEQRECIMLFYFAELSVEQISQTMECSTGTVKSRLNYGRKKIKEGVLELEKRDGIRLHTVAPIGLLFKNLPQLAEGLLPTSAEAAAGWTAVVEAIGARAATGTSVGVAAGAAKNSFFASIKAKVICGVTAAAVVASGVAYYQSQPKPLEFTDAAFEHNVRIFIDKPEGKIFEEDIAHIRNITILEDGMYIGLWSQEEQAAPGTLPVNSFEDLGLFPKHGVNITYDEPVDISSLYGLPSIGAISTSSGFADYSVLKTLPNLMECWTVIHRQEDLDAISELEGLKGVGLNFSEQLNGPLNLDLSRLVNVKILSIGGSYYPYFRNSVQIYAGNELPKLLEVYVDLNCTDNLDFLAAAKNLRILEAHYNSLPDIEFLYGHEELRLVELGMDVTLSEEQIRGLDRCPNLEFLLSMSEEFPDYEMKQAKYLNRFYNPELYDVYRDEVLEIYYEINRME